MIEPKSPEALRAHLHTNGCGWCDLGFQPDINGCCVARGPNDANKMIIGEAPGKEEDSTRLPFTGKAGRLLDDIWKAAGMDTKDWYITNIILCRPIAPKGSGRENLTPKVEQRNRCRPYLRTQISLLKPRIIVTLGRPATETILSLKGIRIGDYRGRLQYLWEHEEQTLVFPMLHPAAILHATGTEKYDIYRQQTWDDVRKLKQILIERNL